MKKLTGISSAMIFRKEGENVVLRVKSGPMAASYTIPKEDFDFYGEEIGFADFKNFLDHLDSFREEGREISQDTVGNIEIRTGTCALKYRTSDIRILKKHAFSEVQDSSPIIVELLLSKGDLATISNACRKVKPDEVKLTFGEDGETLVHVINTKTYTQFRVTLGLKSRTYEVASVSLNPEIVTEVPENDYELSVSKIGRCTLSAESMVFFCGLKHKVQPKEVKIEVEEEVDA